MKSWRQPGGGWRGVRWQGRRWRALRRQRNRGPARPRQQRRSCRLLVCASAHDKRSAVNETAARFEISEPRLVRQGNPAQIEFFKAREGSDGTRQLGERIAAEVELPELAHVADRGGKRGQLVVAKVELA